MRRAAALVVALVSPLLLAATDPTGDVGPCPPGTPGDGDPRIDIVEARGEIIEQGLALRFTIVFARALEAPDEEGTPLRIDVVLHDPKVPTVDFRYYRDLNRIVRFDALPDPLLQIALLPEQGANRFPGAVALGDTLTMTLPGRLVTRDADLEGLGLEQMRWGVIARDEDDCDALGDGRPTERLVEASPTPTPAPTTSPTPDASPTDEPGPPISPAPLDDPPAWIGWAIVGGAIALAWSAAIVIRRRGPRGFGGGA